MIPRHTSIEQAEEGGTHHRGQQQPAQEGSRRLCQAGEEGPDKGLPPGASGLVEGD